MSWNIGGLRSVVSVDKPRSCEVCKAKALTQEQMLEADRRTWWRWSEDERYTQLNGRAASECGIH